MPDKTVKTNVCHSHWNYRVLVTDHGNAEHEFAIHEVYYDENEKPIAFTEQPVPVSADNADDLVWVMRQFEKACSKPFLSVKNFPQKVDLYALKRKEAAQ